nr:MAG TPA: hypothetical protein [Bacteriophage sp.]
MRSLPKSASTCWRTDCPNPKRFPGPSGESFFMSAGNA